jgi:hypothetical protein
MQADTECAAFSMRNRVFFFEFIRRLASAEKDYGEQNAGHILLKNPDRNNAKIPS